MIFRTLMFRQCLAYDIKGCVFNVWPSGSLVLVTNKILKKELNHVQNKNRARLMAARLISAHLYDMPRGIAVTPERASDVMTRTRLRQTNWNDGCF